MIYLFIKLSGRGLGVLPKPLPETLASNWVQVQPTRLAYRCSALPNLSIAEGVAQEVSIAVTTPVSNRPS